MDSEDESHGSDSDNDGDVMNTTYEEEGEELELTPRGKSKIEWNFGYEMDPFELPEYTEKKEFAKLEVPVKRVQKNKTF